MRCTICLAEDDAEYLSPCKCAGTIKFIHKTCLLRYMSYGNSHCSVCRERYKAPSLDYLFDRWCRPLFVTLTIIIASLLGTLVWIFQETSHVWDRVAVSIALIYVAIIAPYALVLSVLAAGFLRINFYLWFT